MDTPITEPKTPARPTGADFSDENFRPVGAVAFFALLIALCLIIWFSIYFLMLSRQ